MPDALLSPEGDAHRRVKMASLDGLERAAADLERRLEDERRARVDAESARGDAERRLAEALAEIERLRRREPP